MAQDKLLYKIDEVAAILECSPSTVRRYVTSGALRARLIGRAYRITNEALLEFMEVGTPNTAATNERRSATMKQKHMKQKQAREAEADTDGK